MTVRQRLMVSLLLVVALPLLVMAISTAFIAPAAFSEDLRAVPLGQGPPNTQTDGTPAPGQQQRGRGGMSMMDRYLEDFGVDLLASFRASVNRALLVATAGAVLAAVGISWYLSRRIVQPLHDLGRASESIAAGHYNERLIVHGSDELAALTQNFNRMASALAETEAMRQQLMADVSHELKTPLATIKGYMEGLQDGIIPATPEMFERIHREADRLQRLVHDLQELSRAEAEQLALQITEQDAGGLATAAASWLQPQFEDESITLTLDLPESALCVQADFDRIRQVLLNLLGNALQYTPPGGTVTLRVVREDGMARFAVTDNGIGLSAADIDRVFQRFYRVDRSRSRAGGGSGIGLTIARHIVEAHGGRIQAASPGPGQGSTFSFTLPLA